MGVAAPFRWRRPWMRQGAAERWTNRRRVGNVASRQWVHARVRLRGGRQIACAVARWLRLFGNPACRVRHRHLVSAYEVPASIGTMPACSGLMRRSGWACEARQVLAVRGKNVGVPDVTPSYERLNLLERDSAYRQQPVLYTKGQGFKPARTGFPLQGSLSGNQCWRGFAPRHFANLDADGNFSS